MSGRLSQNSPAGRRSHIRVVRPVDVAAVLLHTEARAFTRRALTRLPLGVRPTVLRGPGNSVRRHNRAAFIRFHQKSQNEGGSNRPYRSHPSVPLILRHSVPVSVLHMKGQKPWNFLGRRRSEEIWKAA